jgi:hypothetical protein
MCKVTLPDFILTEFFLWELGYPARITSGSSTLRGELGASILWYCVCGPFAAQGAQGKKSTPSVGWEVPVRSHG